MANAREPTREGMVEALIEEADALEDAGLLRECLAKWREVVAVQRTAVTLCRLGSVAADVEAWDEAEQALLDSVTMAPNWRMPREVLALLYRDRGDLAKAEVQLRRSLETGRTARTLTMLGDVLYRRGMDAEAGAALREAIAIDPSYEEAHFLLGRVTRDDPTEAIAGYRRAIELDPGYASAHRELGWTLRRLGLLDEAERHVRIAIERDGADVWALVYLGNILWAKSQVDEAEAAFRRAIAVDGHFTTAYWCLADLVRRRGRLTEARRLLREGLRTDMTSVEANLHFALLLRDAGEPRKATRYLRRVLRLDPTNKRARDLLSAG